MTACPSLVADPDVPGRVYQCVRDRHADDQHVTRTRMNVELSWGGTTTRVGPPRPANLDAMAAAYRSGDKAAIAREIAAYDQQLIAAGYAPVTPAARLDGLER